MRRSIRIHIYGTELHGQSPGHHWFLPDLESFPSFDFDKIWREEALIASVDDYQDTIFGRSLDTLERQAFRTTLDGKIHSEGFNNYVDFS